jgi:hypothetical protein
MMAKTSAWKTVACLPRGKLSSLPIGCLITPVPVPPPHPGSICKTDMPLDAGGSPSTWGPVLPGQRHHPLNSYNSWVSLVPNFLKCSWKDWNSKIGMLWHHCLCSACSVLATHCVLPLCSASLIVPSVLQYIYCVMWHRDAMKLSAV